jgi:hypothetical protein
VDVVARSGSAGDERRGDLAHFPPRCEAVYPENQGAGRAYRQVILL